MQKVFCAQDVYSFATLDKSTSIYNLYEIRSTTRRIMYTKKQRGRGVAWLRGGEVPCPEHMYLGTLYPF